jgi:hypothetical protein
MVCCSSVVPRVWLHRLADAPRARRMAACILASVLPEPVVHCNDREPAHAGKAVMKAVRRTGFRAASRWQCVRSCLPVRSCLLWAGLGRQAQRRRDGLPPQNRQKFVSGSLAGPGGAGCPGSSACGAGSAHANGRRVDPAGWPLGLSWPCGIRACAFWQRPLQRCSGVRWDQRMPGSWWCCVRFEQPTEWCRTHAPSGAYVHTRRGNGPARPGSRCCLRRLWLLPAWQRPVAPGRRAWCRAGPPLHIRGRPSLLGPTWCQEAIQAGSYAAGCWGRRCLQLPLAEWRLAVLISCQNGDCVLWVRAHNPHNAQCAGWRCWPCCLPSCLPDVHPAALWL